MCQNILLYCTSIVSPLFVCCFVSYLVSATLILFYLQQVSRLFYILSVYFRKLRKKALIYLFYLFNFQLTNNYFSCIVIAVSLHICPEHT